MSDRIGVVDVEVGSFFFSQRSWDELEFSKFHLRFALLLSILADQSNLINVQVILHQHTFPQASSASFLFLPCQLIIVRITLPIRKLPCRYSLVEHDIQLLIRSTLTFR